MLVVSWTESGNMSEKWKLGVQPTEIAQTDTMATNAIINVASIDINKVSIGDIRANKAGGKTVPIKYNGQNLQLRIPKMMYSMGVNIKETENGMNYTLSASLKNCDPFARDRAPADTGEVGTLYNFLKDLEEKVLQASIKSSGQWFGKTRKEEILRESLKSMMSPSVDKVNGEWVPNGKYPPSFRMKVPVYDGKVSMDVVDNEGRPIAMTPENLESVFPKRVEASIVVAPSIYVSGQGFGVTWRIGYARVLPPQRLTAAQVFADEMDEEVTESVPAAQESETAEERAEEETVPFDAPAPAPAPAAKNRRRVVAVA